jgi:hypothetical protein
MTMYRLSLDVNIHDPEALHTAAYAAYVGDNKSAEKHDAAISWLGTPEAPHIGHCLIEIWAEHTPVDSGYEFNDWEDTVAIA